MSAVLSVTGLAKHYGELQALHDVSFELEPGETAAIVGANGAGKTTLLSILAGTLAPSAGEVSGCSRAIGWAPQQPALYSKLSVAENLALFARLERVSDAHAAVEQMLDQTGLKERSGDLVGRLSGGNRQRVNVAAALIGSPPVLALDEPSSALDPAQRERLWKFIASLTAAGTAVLFSTHNPAEAQRHATRLLVLDGGRLCFDGTPGALLARGGSTSADLEQALVEFLERQGASA